VGSRGTGSGAIVLASGDGLLADGLDRIGALGRLEPRGGVRHVYGPPHPVAVIEELKVDEGDRVAVGDVVALLAGIGPARAGAERARALAGNARRELERNQRLSRSRVVSDVQLEALETAAAVARADLERAQEEVALYTVRSPIAGQVLEIHVRAGERVGPEGIAELGDTAAMYAIAEVYETDAARIAVGQRIRSPALRASSTVWSSASD
jgi:multidrug efflux pump subunit AcrA (membrane-fusion protein)